MPDRGRRPDPAEHADKKVGYVSITAFPVLTVYAGEQRKGDTPLELALPAGTHVLELRNAETGKTESLPITVREGETIFIDRTR